MKGKRLSLKNVGAVHTLGSIKEENEKIRNKNQSIVSKTDGITLVALVVTIVVLLILAGITITYVFGDNGVFKKAQEAKNRTENAIEDEKAYMNDIGNTIDKYINGTGIGGNTETPIEPTDPEEPEDWTDQTNWEEIAEMAKQIAKNTSINSSSSEATVTINGESKTIKVGDIYRVKYNGELRLVRVLGFKHDDLVNTGVYGSGITATKAGISFEFYDFMTGDTYMSMNLSATNEDGWANTQMRKDLNGYTTSELEQEKAIGGLGAKLSNREYIKQVKKQYIKTYDDASSNNQYANDYLWLLASSEVVKDGESSGYYGVAITSEGSQYKYYQGVTEAWDESSMGRVKNIASSSAHWWWLRSPYYRTGSDFCSVFSDGYVADNIDAGTSGGVAPGFAI